MVADVLADNAHYDGSLLRDSNFVRREEVLAFIGAPIRDATTDEMLGVLYLNYRTARNFGERDKRLAESFANLAAAAIRSSNATRQMQAGLQAAESRGQSNEHELRRLSAMLEESLTTTEEGNLIRTVLTAVRDLLNQPDLHIGVMLRDWKPSQPELEPREIRRQYYLNRDNTVSFTEEQNIYRGIIGVAIGGGESQLVSDVSQPEWQHFYHKAWPETRSELVVPIKFGPQIIGAINIESPRAGVLTAAHQVTLERLANATALALDNVRRQGHLHSILSAATAITLPVDLKATLQAVVQEIGQTVRALSCLTIWYREPTGDRILPGPSFGVHDTTSMQLPLARDSVVLHVMQLSEPIWALVAAEESHLSGRFVKAEQIISTAAFPLRADNDTVGAMFFNYRQPHDFTAEEEALFPILAAIVAASVRDAAHLERIRTAYRNLDAALAITNAVNTASDLNNVLGSIMATLCSLFKGAVACVMTYDDTKQMLTFLPASRRFYPIDEIAYIGLLGTYLHDSSIASDVARQSLRTGLTAKANVGDVDTDPRYLRLIHNTKSELCISLMSTAAELLGVVVMERPEREAFDDEEVQLITSAAQHISMAIERVNQTKQLRFKSTVATATAWASDIAHEMNREVSNIRNKVARISRLVPLAEEALQLLVEIDTSADRLAMAQNSSLLTMNAEFKEFELDVELEARVREIVARASRPTELYFDLGCAGHKVNVRQAVFGRVLRHLVRNAIQAMRDLDDSQLFVRTRLWRDRFIQVFIEDIGLGVPDDVLTTLFEVPATEGRGYGLLFVRAAVEDILGGRVWYMPRTAEHGPIFTFTIPATNHVKGEE